MAQDRTQQAPISTGALVPAGVVLTAPVMDKLRADALKKVGVNEEPETPAQE